jgi:hypothetical protein
MSCSSITLWVGEIIVDLKPLAMFAAKLAIHVSCQPDVLDAELNGMVSISSSGIDGLFEILFTDCVCFR